MHPFRQAVEARDIDAIGALLADDVAFFSPVMYRPYRGKSNTLPILYGVLRVFQDFRYHREIAARDGRDHAFLFRATVNGLEVQGVDVLRFDEHGKITEFTVMVRPMSGIRAVAEAMAVQFERVQLEAALAGTL
ncbi:nuclear transport factor 2 family protein [Spirillospora albida]|uniref:nuclear transport factor 2 family protein n=1 Tax=Spirillospora albida TaxID=58123 RepID=UPI0004BEA19C|nr:nuclear transport factor 2 family protein [Spirillospora albida]